MKTGNLPPKTEELAAMVIYIRILFSTDVKRKKERPTLIKIYSTHVTVTCNVHTNFELNGMQCLDTIVLAYIHICHHINSL